GEAAEASRLLVMFGGSTATACVASLLTPPRSLDGLVEFYRRARPPGWWAPIARAADDPHPDGVRRLGIGILRVASATLALFSVLTLLGSLLAGSAPPTWCPSRATWWSLLVVLAAAGVAVLWRARHHDGEPPGPPT
nr:hypothetical protein [Myxococcota bacterium]